MEKKQDEERKWKEELCNRIAQMEEGDSEIRSMTQKDYIVAGVITVFCLCAVILGAWL